MRYSAVTVIRRLSDATSIPLADSHLHFKDQRKTHRNLFRIFQTSFRPRLDGSITACKQHTANHMIEYMRWAIASTLWHSIKPIDLKVSVLRRKIDDYFVECQIAMLTCRFQPYHAHVNKSQSESHTASFMRPRKRKQSKERYAKLNNNYRKLYSVSMLQFSHFPLDFCFVPYFFLRAEPEQKKMNKIGI